MKKKTKVLHLASFLGNIGDYANHQGFYKKFNEIIPSEFSQIEIRKFYKNRAEAKFDSEMLKTINSHDLFVIGGGGFFDLKWSYSSTGTTLDFATSFIQGIKIPVLVNAIGYHEYEETSKGHIEKFRRFLKEITSYQRWFIAVRNDGSFDRLQRRYGDLTEGILKAPDNGFYYNPRPSDRLSLESNDGSVWIGLNITNELFRRSFNAGISTDFLNSEMSRFINEVLEENGKYKIILFPHAHQDIAVISSVLGGVSDKLKRERIIVAPLITSESAIDAVFDLYRICACVIGMRFHANVCSIAMGVPSLGLAGHEQISSLYDELGIAERCVKVNKKDFAELLRQKLRSSLARSEKIKESYKALNAKIKRDAKSYFGSICEWFSAI